MKFRKACSIILTALFILTALGGCESGSRSQTADQVLGSGSKVLRILSGSENSELEPILEQFANENDMRIEMTYQALWTSCVSWSRISSPTTLCGPRAPCGSTSGTPL